jgi:hypothetical protein
MKDKVVVMPFAHGWNCLNKIAIANTSPRDRELRELPA